MCNRWIGARNCIFFFPPYSAQSLTDLPVTPESGEMEN